MHPFSTLWCFQWVEKGCIGNEWVNRRAGYGFEVQMDYTFYGNDRAIKWAQKLITLIMKDKDSISKNIIK